MTSEAWACLVQGSPPWLCAHFGNCLFWALSECSPPGTQEYDKGPAQPALCTGFPERTMTFVPGSSTELGRAHQPCSPEREQPRAGTLRRVSAGEYAALLVTVALDCVPPAVSAKVGG